MCRKVFALAAFILCGNSVFSQVQYPAAVESDWIVRDFRFHTGDVLPELRLHYATVGRQANPAIVLLHGTGQAGTNLLSPSFAGELFGSGQPLDANRFFIIIPDAIGHGKSSKPSDGLGMRFTSYNYEDMVAAQYRLVTEHLGMTHARLVLGNSMGGMHAWLWGERYPSFMDAIVPLASQPIAMGGRNWMIRRFVIDAIRNDPEWRNGNYRNQPPALQRALAFYNIVGNGGSLARYTRAPSRRLADAEYDRVMAATAADANDLLYQFESAGDYDPEPNLDRITASLLAINSADDEKNPPELGVMERAIKRLTQARYVLLPIDDRSIGHGTTTNAAIWKGYLAQFLETVK